MAEHSYATKKDNSKPDPKSIAEEHNYCKSVKGEEDTPVDKQLQILSSSPPQHNACVPIPLIEIIKQEQLATEISDSSQPIDDTILGKSPSHSTDQKDADYDPFKPPCTYIKTPQPQKRRVYGPAFHAPSSVKLKIIEKEVNFNLIPVKHVYGGPKNNEQRKQEHVEPASQHDDLAAKARENQVKLVPIKNLCSGLQKIECHPQHDHVNPPPQHNVCAANAMGNKMKQITLINSNLCTARRKTGIYLNSTIAKINRGKPSLKKIKNSSDNTPQVRLLLRKLDEYRTLIKNLRRQANVIKNIKSPLLKSLIITADKNQKRKPHGKRWPEAAKILALEIYKKSPSAYKYVSELLLLPNTRTLQKMHKIATGEPQLKITVKNTENVLCDLLLRRINKITKDTVNNTQKSLKMKILIKGDRNVGKSCLLQRLQGGPFIEEYVPTEQIQVAPIHWTHKDSDHIVKVEVWEVVDKGRAKKKPPLGLKLENQTAPSIEDSTAAPVLDATFLDVYKNASGVILMMDITKPWTFEYVVKELAQVPADLPVVILGNHCDMQHHRQVHPHHIEQAMLQAKLNRTAPVRYAESSMRNGFGLRLLHKFLSVPFLRLQRASLLQQLQRNQRETEHMEREIDEFQCSDEAHYNAFVERLASKRRGAAEEVRPPSDRSPSIIVGAGRPIVPPAVNPLVAQSLNPKPKPATPPQQRKQHQYIYPELLKPNPAVTVETLSAPLRQDSAGGAAAAAGGGALDEFYAGTLDSSFLEDLPVASNQELAFDSDSDDGDIANPMVANEQDDLDDSIATNRVESTRSTVLPMHKNSNEDLNLRLKTSLTLGKSDQAKQRNSKGDREHTASRNRSMLSMPSLDSDFPLWAGDSSARRSPEGGEDPDVAEKVEKKHKKKKPKDKGDYSEKSERKKLKKPKSMKSSSSAQSGLLGATEALVSHEEYDSI